MSKLLKAAVLMLVLLMVFAVSCQKSQEKVAEKATKKAIEHETSEKAEVNYGKNKVTVKTKEGKFELSKKGNVKVPEGFPDDIYIYPGARVAMSMKQPEGLSVTLVSSDEMNVVADKYAANMKKNGWTEEGVAQMPQMRMLSYKKGDREAMIQMAPGSEEGKTMITIMAQENK